ncbi:LysR family transcriptional regulator [Falsibacillus pallidus]|uniref:LysR family transcriptional regulator n=1 Tax=Falsibacillus pallidus TaxID=493781 RepID=UPI003D975383
MEQKYLVFLTVARERSFSKAAEALFMTQPAVSQYIAGLEKELGAALLIRQPKNLKLTKAGEILQEYVLEMKELQENMNRAIQFVLNEPKGEIRIGASYTFGEYILPHTISDLLVKYPEVHPSITIGNTAEIADRVLANKLDIGVIEGQKVHKELSLKKLSEDEMYLIAGKNHHLAKKKKPIEMEDLANERWIVREKGSGTREAVDQCLAKHHLKPTDMMEFGSTQIIKESVEAGLGITLLSKWAIRKEVDAGVLKILDCDDTPVVRDFSIIKQWDGGGSKTIDVFSEVLREYFGG